MRTGVRYGAILIAIYLGVYYWTGAGTLLEKGSTGTANVVRAFQGR